MTAAHAPSTQRQLFESRAAYARQSQAASASQDAGAVHPSFDGMGQMTTQAPSMQAEAKGQLDRSR